MAEPRLPGYWMNETSGELRPAIVAYLKGKAMTRGQVDAMRAYLRQWIAGNWSSCDGELEALRAGVDGLVDRTAIKAWLDAADRIGIHPL